MYCHWMTLYACILVGIASGCERAPYVQDSEASVTEVNKDSDPVESLTILKRKEINPELEQQHTNQKVGEKSSANLYSDADRLLDSVGAIPIYSYALLRLGNADAAGRRLERRAGRSRSRLDPAARIKDGSGMGQPSV